MAPNQNGMIAKSKNDESSTLVNRSSRIVVSVYLLLLMLLKNPSS